MMTHEQIWQAIDRLAAAFGYSPSGLAIKAGLDPTSFNKSKRVAPTGKPRWPSTESVSRILEATGATMSDFIALIDESVGTSDSKKSIPMISMEQLREDRYFDEDGRPLGDRWNSILFPALDTRESYDDLCALEVSGDSMLPLYRDGDILVLSPQSDRRTGDRVVLKTLDSKVMVGELVKLSQDSITMRLLMSTRELVKVPTSNTMWLYRILWASQ